MKTAVALKTSKTVSMRILSSAYTSVRWTWPYSMHVAHAFTLILTIALLTGCAATMTALEHDGALEPWRRRQAPASRTLVTHSCGGKLGDQPAL
ncbi:MAG: hypothetical protein ACREYE_04690 [Gammaproteobacteria bacterium]